MRVLRFSVMTGAVLAFALACGSSGTATQAPPAGTQAPAAGTEPPAATGCVPMTLGRAVDIVDFGYDPETITVAVDETVTWANTGATTHTVTFTGGPDCGNVASNAGISRTFDTAGTFEYICTIHPQMTGTVVVQ